MVGGFAALALLLAVKEGKAERAAEVALDGVGLGARAGAGDATAEAGGLAEVETSGLLATEAAELAAGGGSAAEGAALGGSGLAGGGAGSGALAVVLAAAIPATGLLVGAFFLAITDQANNRSEDGARKKSVNRTKAMQEVARLELEL